MSDNKENTLTPADEINPPTSIEAIQATAPVQSGVTTFPTAGQAKDQAKQQFRKGVLQVLKQSVEGGINKAMVEVSAVREELVDELESELLELGFNVTYNNQVKNNRGYTSRAMVITY